MDYPEHVVTEEAPIILEKDPDSKLTTFIVRRSFRFLCVVTIIAFMLITWQFFRLTSIISEKTALYYASLFSQAIADFRVLYTSEVVTPIRENNGKVVHNYKDVTGAIPLPATLSIMLGEKISETMKGATTRLYSDYPFPFRKSGGARDKFEQDALEILRIHPDQPYYSFESYGDRYSIRYATADFMQERCVSCHNTHPESPKRDWKEGDVRGVLEIILPMENINEQIRQGIWEAIAMTTVLCLGGLGCLYMTIGGLRKSYKQAQDFALKTKNLNSQMKAEIIKQKKMEAILAEQKEKLESMNATLHHENEVRKIAELQLKQALIESEESRREVDLFNSFAIERENDMLKLKTEINKILIQHGSPPKYDLDDIENSPI